MARRLSDNTVAARMVELRNLRRLHAQDRKQIATLKAENKSLRAENAELRATVATLQIQIAELQAMVFGKRRRPPTGTFVPALPLAHLSEPRDAASYHRVIPDDSAVTATELCPVSSCMHCSYELTDLTEHVRYVEDIPLPELTPGYTPHLVTKYIVARGVCSACGRTTSGRELGGAEVSLGPNVQLLATDLISRMGLSYSQVSGLLLGLYGLRVSGGELANLLGRQHRAWLPAYNRLKAGIRAAPVKHYDETPWNIQALQGAGFAWSMSASASADVCFVLENSRGARHARELHGGAGGIFVTDGYVAYSSLPGTQQLCWAHLYRAIRDLAYNDNLSEAQLPYVRQWYASFAGIYSELRVFLAESYDNEKRTRQAGALWQKLHRLAAEAVPASGQPDKLRRLKAQLLKAGKDKLFVCLSADAPCDNNRAERDLRQLVLKRKRSFGSKTEKGAQALATVLSLCTTTWRKAQNNSNPAGYFSSLAALAG